MYTLAKVLFLPLLQIPSGHHQAADAIGSWLTMHISDLEIEKIELLSYMNKTLEKLVSQVYLKWIGHFPSVYNWMYRQVSLQSQQSQKEYHSYKVLFLHVMRSIIAKSKPDIIICTQSLPSYLCSCLKRSGHIQQPVVNVYTDFFMNQVWGIDGIDLHLASSKWVEQRLIQQAVDASRIFVTGIPVDRVFHEETKPNRLSRDKLEVVIAGGSSGVGFTRDFTKWMLAEDGIDFKILCGQNKRLYQSVLELKCTHIEPVPYISSRQEMKQLYDQMDALVTKPGGVTVSEAIYRGVPIFIHSALPGQEEVNRNFLLEERLAFPIDPNASLVEQMNRAIGNANDRFAHVQKMDHFRRGLQWNQGLNKLIEVLLNSRPK